MEPEDVNTLSDEEIQRMMDEIVARADHNDMCPPKVAIERTEKMLKFNSMDTDTLLESIRHTQRLLNGLHEDLELAEHILDGRRHGLSRSFIEKAIGVELERAKQMVEKEEADKAKKTQEER